MAQAAYVVDAWFPRTMAQRDGTLLFCLPYAGGSATAFRGWADQLPPNIACLPVHLPGRAGRLTEPPEIDIAELSRAICERAAEQPFAIFGHSMGAKLAFEVTRELRRAGAALPMALFVGGARPPHMDTPLTRIARLPDDEFCARLSGMGGTPAGLLDNPEMRALLLPALRADFAMVEAYRYRPEPPLPVPVVVLAGAEDPEADACDMTGWSAHTTGPVRLATLPGNHFFLHSAQSAVLAIIAREIRGSHAATGRPPVAVKRERAERGDGLGVSDLADRLALRDLADDEVLIVEARLDELVDLSRAVAELSPQEQRRAASISWPVDAARFVARTALLRRILRAGGVSVGTAELPRGPFGKPSIAHRSGLRFNASQSHGRLLLAFSRGREIGVDIEVCAALCDADPLTARGLHADEREALAYLPDDEILPTALRIWTAKQAVLKAAGNPTAIPPADFGFDDPSRRPWRVAARAGLEHLFAWQVYHVDLAGAVGALAIASGGWRLRYELIRGGDR